MYVSLFNSLAVEKKEADSEGSRLTAKIIFTYSTEHLKPKDKVLFFYKLNGRGGQKGVIESTSSEKLGRTVLLTPSENAKTVEQFLKEWKCRLQKLRVFE